jgi:hypothetical protein
MAVILQFIKREAAQPALPEGHSAQILIYNGVRFERLDGDSATPTPVAADITHTGQTRLAN